MILNESQARGLCETFIRQHLELADEARLNRTSGSTILGLSRSRYAQLVKNPSTIVQAHVFLNLVNANDAVQKGLDEGWLPAGSLRGAAQDEAVKRLTGG